jgi:hypothetical protein
MEACVSLHQNWQGSLSQLLGGAKSVLKKSLVDNMARLQFIADHKPENTNLAKKNNGLLGHKGWQRRN